MSKFNFGTAYTIFMFIILSIVIAASYYKYIVLEDFNYAISNTTEAGEEAGI